MLILRSNFTMYSVYVSNRMDKATSMCNGALKYRYSRRKSTGKSQGENAMKY